METASETGKQVPQQEAKITQTKSAIAPGQMRVIKRNRFGCFF